MNNPARSAPCPDLDADISTILTGVDTGRADGDRRRREAFTLTAGAAVERAGRVLSAVVEADRAQEEAELVRPRG